MIDEDVDIRAVLSRALADAGIAHCRTSPVQGTSWAGSVGVVSVMTRELA